MPETFNFPFHSPLIEYPESSATIRFGRGYTFASKPMGPDQLTFRLQFSTMFYVTNPAGVFSNSLLPELNMLRLQEFYETHRLFEPFIYPHDLKGNVTCRFSKPLVTPRTIPGAVTVGPTYRRHQVESFEIILISQA